MVVEEILYQLVEDGFPLDNLLLGVLLTDAEESDE
jgi:hypothetical protein